MAAPLLGSSTDPTKAPEMRIVAKPKETSPLTLNPDHIPVGPVIGHVSPASRAVSAAPLGWPIVGIDPVNPPEVVPDKVVLEFPTGEKVWRSAHEDRGIVIESLLGPGSRRQGFENAYYSRGEMGRPDYVESDLEKGHSQGAGTGFECRYGIRYEPREANQVLKNLGIEEFLRELGRNRVPGIAYQMVTNTRAHSNSLRLSLVEYTVNALYKGERRLLFTTGIRAEGSKVSVAKDLTEVRPEAFRFLPGNDLPASMLERRLELMSRIIRGRQQKV